MKPCIRAHVNCLSTCCCSLKNSLVVVCFFVLRFIGKFCKCFWGTDLDFVLPVNGSGRGCPVEWPGENTFVVCGWNRLLFCRVQDRAHHCKIFGIGESLGRYLWINHSMVVAGLVFIKGQHLHVNILWLYQHQKG